MSAVTSLTPISIAGRAGQAFPPHTMVQGFACFSRGVEIMAENARHLRARVRSKRVHEVDVQCVDGELVVHCSCAARSLGFAACKHLWAVLLEADRRLAFEALRGTRKPLDIVLAPESALPAIPPTESPPGVDAKRPRAGRAVGSKPTASAKPAASAKPNSKTVGSATTRAPARKKTATSASPTKKRRART